MRHARLPLCISDPTLPDNPIVFANDAFSELTGYAEAEVVGRNCRFLQGDGTTPESIRSIKEIIASRTVGTVEIVNYRKDGTEFVNVLQVGPIFDESGALQYYFGSQLDVTEQRKAEREARDLAEAELFHRLRNISNVMSSIIRMTAREHQNVESFAQVITDRLHALCLTHFGSPAAVRDEVGLEDLIWSVVSGYQAKDEGRIRLKGPEVMVSHGVTTPVALALHELATNAFKYGALSEEGGRVEVSWTHDPADGVAIEWRETGGPALTAPEKVSGTGIIARLLKSAGASLVMDWQRDGLVACLRMTDGVTRTG